MPVEDLMHKDAELDTLSLEMPLYAASWQPGRGISARGFSAQDGGVEHQGLEAVVGQQGQVWLSLAQE